MFIGIGTTLPQIADLPGPSRPGYPSGSPNFIMEVTTTATNKQFTFSSQVTTPSLTNIEVDFGDGTSPVSNTGSVISHTFPDFNTTYTIEVSGEKWSGGKFSNQNVSKVVNWGDFEWSNFNQVFQNCQYLTEVPPGLPLGPAVGMRMYYAYYNSGIQGIDIRDRGFTADCRNAFGLCPNLSKVILKNITVKNGTNLNDLVSGSFANVPDGAETDLSGWTIDNTPGFNMVWWRNLKFKGDTLNMSGWTHINNSSIDTGGGAGYLTGVQSKTDATFKLDMSNWTGMNNYNSINLKRFFMSSYVNEWDISGWGDCSNVYSFQEFCRETNNLRKVKGLQNLNSHPTNFIPTGFNSMFYRTRNFRFFTDGNLRANFGANQTTATDFNSMFNSCGSSLTEAEVTEAGVESPNFGDIYANNVTSIVYMFYGAKFPTRLDFKNMNLSKLTGRAFNQAFYSTTVYDRAAGNSVIDLSGVTIDGTTAGLDWYLMVGNYSTINCKEIDLSSPNISFAGTTNIAMGNAYGIGSGLVKDDFKIKFPNTATYDFSNVVDGIQISNNTGVGEVMLPEDYTKCLIALAANSATNQAIRVAQTKYNAGQLADGTEGTGNVSLGPSPSAILSTNGLTRNAWQNAGSTERAPTINWVSLGATTSDIAFYQYYQNVPAKYADITAISTTTSTNDTIESDIDNIAGNLSPQGADACNVLAGPGGIAAKTLVDRGWSIVDGDFVGST